MKTGRIHVFQYESGGVKYKIEPWIGDDDALGQDGDLNTPPRPAPITPPPREPALPEETKFALAMTTTTSSGDASTQGRGRRR